MKTKMSIVVAALLSAVLLSGVLWFLAPPKLAQTSSAAPRVSVQSAFEQNRVSQTASPQTTENSIAAITAFAPPHGYDASTECPVPYFTVAPDKLPMEIHVMNHNPNPANLNLYFWGEDGGDFNNAVASVSFNLPAYGSKILDSALMSEALGGRLLSGTALITSTNTVACVVKHTPKLPDAEYMATYTPRQDRYGVGLVIPWIGSPRSDLYPQVYLYNTHNNSETFYLNMSIDGTPVVPLTITLEAHALHIYDCLLYTSPSPRDRTRSRMPSSA